MGVPLLTSNNRLIVLAALALSMAIVWIQLGFDCAPQPQAIVVGGDAESKAPAAVGASRRWAGWNFWQHRPTLLRGAVLSDARPWVTPSREVQCTYHLRDPGLGELRVRVHISSSRERAVAEVQSMLRFRQESESLFSSLPTDAEGYIGISRSGAPVAWIRSSNMTVLAFLRDPHAGSKKLMAVLARQLAQVVESTALPNARLHAYQPLVAPDICADVVPGETTSIRVPVVDPQGNGITLMPSSETQRDVSIHVQGMELFVGLDPASAATTLTVNAWAVSESLIAAEVNVKLSVLSPPTELASEIDGEVDGDVGMDREMNTQEPELPGSVLFQTTTRHFTRADFEAKLEAAAVAIGLTDDLQRAGYLSGFDPGALGASFRIVRDNVQFFSLSAPVRRELVVERMGLPAVWSVEVRVGLDHGMARQQFLYEFTSDISSRWELLPGLSCVCYRSDARTMGCGLRLLQDNVVVIASANQEQDENVLEFATLLCRAIESTSAPIGETGEYWPRCEFALTGRVDERGREGLEIRALALGGGLLLSRAGPLATLDLADAEDTQFLRLLVPRHRPRITCLVVDRATRVSVSSFDPPP